MTPEIAERLKKTLTELVVQDGGAIELVQYSNDSIEFNLVLNDVKCAECVMPKDFLEQIIFEKAQAIFKNLKCVIRNDPRRN